MDNKELLELIHYYLNSETVRKMPLEQKRKFIIGAMANDSFKVSEGKVNIILDEIIYANIDDLIVFQKKGFTPWLSEVKDKVENKHYFRYEKYLLKVKNRSANVVSSLNKMTDIILDHMKNPKGGYFSSKGLVIGDIQSGKTANYTGLINKAIDYGYKLIIVLAGMTNDLRLQTQRRLDTEVLGYATDKDKDQSKLIGVAEMNIHLKQSAETFVINSLTYSDINGGLKKMSHSINLDSNMTPYIVVIKKNVHELNNLYKFIEKNPILNGEDKKIDIPVLVIDDEVDQASVNTSKSEDFNDATSINRNIRRLLARFNRYSYVGYTATPFANVFIDPKENLPEEEKDLFPEDFIIILPKPKNYYGVKEFFGIDGDMNSEDEFNLDLFRNVDDLDELYKKKKDEVVKKYFESKSLPKSLKEAIMSFVIASAIKSSRGIYENNTMLIHISHFKNPSTTLKPIIEDYIQDEVYTPILYDRNELNKYKVFWEKEFLKTSKKRKGQNFNDDWNKISIEIVNVVRNMKDCVRVLNGDSDDIIDYSKIKNSQHIIIGGNKLSRGLTLEGLVVSYYYRFSKAYDTLMQMGRWFGYRDGWFDLSRIYTDKNLVKNFLDINEAIELFKTDIKYMNSVDLTPADFGMKVRRYPGLVPTARVKMRRATSLKLSFSASVSQQTVFNSNDTSPNLRTINDFIKDMAFSKSKSGNYVIKKINSDRVIDFLKSYKDFDKEETRVTVRSYLDYIIKCTQNNELIDWTIIINSRATESSSSFEIGKYKISKPKRSIRTSFNNSNVYKIKTLVEGSDIKEVFSQNDPLYDKTTFYKPNDLEIQSKFTSKQGLLGIYIVDLIEKKDSINKTILENVPGIAIWFPKSSNEENNAIDFFVNETYLSNKSLELGDNNDEWY